MRLTLAGLALMLRLCPRDRRGRRAQLVVTRLPARSFRLDRRRQEGRESLGLGLEWRCRDVDKRARRFKQGHGGERLSLRSPRYWGRVCAMRLRTTMSVTG
jgi:hypothetical protein